MLRALRYDTVLRGTRYVAIRAPGLTILLSLPSYHIMTYCMMLGYTTSLQPIHYWGSKLLCRRPWYATLI